MTPAAPRFRLDPRLPAPRAIQRLAQTQLDHALASLARGDERGIHEARKAGKRLRALLRLARPALGTGYRVQNLRLRDAGRALAALREADALRATARSLGLGLAVAPPPRASARPRAIARADRLLRAQRRAQAGWPADAPARGDLDPALIEGYRRARRCGREARRHARAATLHEWRKQVKHHRFQCEAAAALWPRLQRRVRALEELGELLGRHHDVEALATELQRHPQRLGGRQAVAAAARRLRREQHRVATRALRAGERLFRRGARAWFAHEVGK